jgi:hypothetical protein
MTKWSIAGEDPGSICGKRSDLNHAVRDRRQLPPAARTPALIASGRNADRAQHETTDGKSQADPSRACSG